MCGHVGYFGREHTLPIYSAFKDLLRVDVVRGRDSVGVYECNIKTGYSWLVKDIYSPDDIFLSLEQGVKVGCNLLLGHNRFATVGRRDRDGAHPFMFENIIGAHNGTLINQNLLLDSKEFDIDSENIFYNIEQEGIEKTWAKINGAAALVYYNKDYDTINFIRNKDRPLFFTRLQDNSGIFWASEKWMLVGCLDRNNIKYGKIKQLSVNTLMSFSFKDNKVFEENTILKPYKPKPYKFVTSNWWDRNKQEDYHGYGYMGSYNKEKKLIEGVEYKLIPMLIRNVFLNYNKKSIDKSYVECRVDGFSETIRVHVFIGHDRDKFKNILEQEVYATTKVKDKRWMANSKSVKIIDTVTIKDNHGVQINEEEFYKRYYKCFNCFTEVAFEDTALDIIDDTTALCGCCSGELVQDEELYSDVKKGVYAQ